MANFKVVEFKPRQKKLLEDIRIYLTDADRLGWQFPDLKKKLDKMKMNPYFLVVLNKMSTELQNQIPLNPNNITEQNQSFDRCYGLHSWLFCNDYLTAE